MKCLAGLVAAAATAAAAAADDGDGFWQLHGPC
jgi:hypothetical protein